MEDFSLPQDIAKIDPENYRQDILNTPLQAEQGYKLADSLDLSSLQRFSFSDIVMAGMGGSSIAGQMLKSYFYDDKVKITVVQDYSLPKWCNETTLVVASSYSGNTEETLSAYKDARRMNCPVVCVTVGGKLEEYARATRTPTLILPGNFQPRAALALQFFALLRIMERLNVVPKKGINISLFRDELKAQLPGIEKNAMALSEKIAGKVPLIYSSNRFNAVGYRWKCQIEENSKVEAFSSAFPELNHNELNGFERLSAPFHAIFIRFEDDHRRVQQRMDLTKEIILRKGVSATDIGVRGSSVLSKMFSTVLLGDLTSYYLALRLKINPSKVPLIEEFKKKLGPYVS